MLFQTEAAECGLACLAMVSSYWGHEIDTASLRRRFSVSIKGATLAHLMRIGRALGLQVRPLKMESPESLSLVRLPCILHWDLNHFVVLKCINSKHAEIYDPATGIRKVSMSTMGKHFTGVALELNVGSTFTPKKELQKFTIRSLMGKVVRLKRNLGWLFLMAFAIQIFALATPFFMQWLIDDALVSGDRPLVTVLCIAFVVLAVLQVFLSTVRSWFTTTFATNLNFQWMGNAFAHLLRLPPTYFEKRHAGDIVSRFGSITTIQRALTTQVVEAVIDALVIIGSISLMAWYSAKLAGLACIVVVLYGCIRTAMYRTMRANTAGQIINTARQQTYFLESVRGIVSLKLNDREEERRVGWTNALAAQFNSDIKVARLSLSFSTSNNLLFQVERILIVWMAAQMVLDNVFTVGMLIGFLGYKDQFSGRASALIDKMFDLRMLRLQGQRVADILLTEPEDVSSIEIDTDEIEASVEFINVSFRYSDGDPWILEGVSFTIPAQQCVAFVGVSGCGKTTIVKLILGLLSPTAGVILIGNRKFGDLGVNNVRHMIGAVMQEDTLFTGSIADNISCFDPEPDLARVQRVAQLAAVSAEIAQMPMRYHTFVGDLGTGLSGGQKQRILLARALYRNPRMLVLDEATSNLDIANEKFVNDAIRGLDLTRIIVAHRTETVAMAERVLMIERGKIIRDLSSEREQVLTDASG